MSVADGTNTLGTFIVVFNKARNLPNKRKLGKQNPFCIARVGHDAKHSKTDVRGGQTPVWDSEVRFTLTPGPQNKELKLSVLDETDGKPELIGDALIPLKEALESNPVDGYDDWHQLTYKGKYAGEVYLEMTFYPSTPPIKKKRSKNGNKDSFRSDAMQQSQALGSSQFTMSSSTPLNMTATTTRPLPEQPGAAAAESTAAPATEPVPVSNVLPHHMQQTNISSHLQYCQNTLPLAPHYQNSTYANYNNNGANSMDMSAMSRTLPNPFDYQEFGELSAIPPEQHQTSYYGSNPEMNNGGYHHSNGSNVSGFGYIPEEEEDPMAIFSTPLPPGPNDAPATSTYEAEEHNNHYQHYAHNNLMNNGAVDEDQCHRSRSTHRYAPAHSSPLSQSTSSDLSDPETPPPAMSGSSAGQLYYQEFSHHHNEQPQDPYYSQQGVDDYYYHSQDHHQQHYGTDLSPVPPAHNSYVAPAATTPPKRSAIRRKPITRRTPCGGNSTGGELPFSAESYSSPIPSISVSPSAADDEAEDEEEEEASNRRHSAPVQNHHHSRRDNGGHETLNASSGAKPLPQAPACEPYVGDGQWDLSDELNAGYSDDVYGGFMQQMPVLRERAASAVDLPSLSKSHHHQQQFRRSRHGDYADEYHGMEMEDGIRYVH